MFTRRMNILENSSTEAFKLQWRHIVCFNILFCYMWHTFKFIFFVSSTTMKILGWSKRKYCLLFPAFCSLCKHAEVPQNSKHQILILMAIVSQIMSETFQKYLFAQKGSIFFTSICAVFDWDGVNFLYSR